MIDEENRQLGHVDKVEVRAGRLCLAGWTLAERVRLVQGSRSVETTPQMPRSDVAAVLEPGRSHQLGFFLDQPFTGERAILSIQKGNSRYVFQLPSASAEDIKRAKIRLITPFAKDLMRAAPAVTRWLINRNLADRSLIKRALGFAEEAGQAADPISANLFASGTAAAPQAIPATPIVVIIPVYNAFDLLPEVLTRVATHTDLPWTLILVEDCSTDTQVRPYLQAWAEARNAQNPDQVILLENETNQGFIRSVNLALARAIDMGQHVVLLNSDALVPAGWASRLIRPILRHLNVATVTPMSNDAEIFSVPVICQRTVLEPGQADAIDRIAQSIDPDGGLAVAPTGVGFCMAVNIDYLRQIGDLDTSFGRGYGEEVDWCQRARALGGRHLGVANLFVEHRGGSSFGSAEKLKLVQTNNAIIASRYTGYDREVQDFIHNDPLGAARLAISIGWIAARATGHVPIYLAHSMGGGAEKYLRERIEAGIEQGVSAIVLRVGGGHRWRLETHTAAGVTFGFTDSLAMVTTMLAPLAQRRIIYSNGVGDQDPFSLPAALLGLRKAPGDQIEVLFHDYFAISPSYCLLDQTGWFKGVPDSADPNPAHTSRRSDGSRVSLAEWRQAWGALMQAANDVVVFSQDSWNQVIAAYPEVLAAMRLVPHQVQQLPPRIEPPPSGRNVIAVLGNIGQQKGAAILSDLSRRLDGNAQTSLVLIGNIDPFYSLLPSTRIHGTYKIADLPDLVAKYGITCWLIPSVWPETFSYVTHEALATGMPVLCFDIGAQADTIRQAANGIVLAFGRSGELTQNVLEAVERLNALPGIAEKAAVA